MSSSFGEMFVVGKKRLAFGCQCRGKADCIRCLDTVIDTEAAREIELRTFEGDKQAAVTIAVVDVEQVVSLITDRLQPGFHVNELAAENLLAGYRSLEVVLLLRGAFDQIDHDSGVEEDASHHQSQPARPASTWAAIDR
jgi:hypothetical protein